MIHREYHKCIGYLDELFREVSSSDHSRFPYLRNHCLEMTVYIVHLLTSYNIDINKLAGDTTNLHYKLLHTQNPRELYQWMRHFLVTATEALENKNTRYSPCISRVVAHIEKHFAQDISLKTMAYDLNINAAYLGQMFKLETGQLFSVYLNRVRIDNAQKLLLQTNCTLSEVSQQCGYANISYFYNIFKKITGQTPSQYRKTKTQ
jgi:two-component system response regulator YesN